MREGSKGEMDFCYDYIVTNKSHNDWKKNFTVFDAENILSKFAQRLKTIIIGIPTTMITSDKKFCIL